jgi:hypothetical protein
MVGRRDMTSDTPDMTSEHAARTLDTPATLPNTPDALPNTPDLTRDRPAVAPGHQSGTSESRSLTSDYAGGLFGDAVAMGNVRYRCFRRISRLFMTRKDERKATLVK